MTSEQNNGEVWVDTRVTTGPNGLPVLVVEGSDDKIKDATAKGALIGWARALDTLEDMIGQMRAESLATLEKAGVPIVRTYSEDPKQNGSDSQ